MLNYIVYSDKYRDKFLEFTVKLQDHIVSIDSFDRVIRNSNFGEYYTEKIFTQINEHGGKIFLAKEDNEVVGMVVALILCRSEEDDLQIKKEKYGEIEKLLVLESHRSKGIGQHLLQMAEEYLVKTGKCDYIEIVVFGDNKKALEIYKKHGYREREFILLKKIRND